MEPTSFLARPQIYISIFSWNINSAKTKLEKQNVSEMLKHYDIISLNEIKTPLSVSYPGYVSIPSRDSSNPSRGGTCVLIKNHLSSHRPVPFLKKRPGKKELAFCVKSDLTLIFIRYRIDDIESISF